jgi:divalent metal cation (Fe/Co/Zn/Cd) transporter
MKKSAGNPDRLHLHQLIGEKLIYPTLGKKRSTHLKSATTGFAVSLFCVPTAVMAYALYDQQNTLIILFLVLSLGYWLVYGAASKMNIGQGIAEEPLEKISSKLNAKPVVKQVAEQHGR